MAKLKHQEGEYYEQLAGDGGRDDAGGNLSIGAGPPHDPPPTYPPVQTSSWRN